MGIVLGGLCFLCETEGASAEGLGRESLHMCQFCPSLVLSSRDRGTLLNHVGAHILFDPRVDCFSTPCGFCLSPSDSCVMYVKKGKGAHQGDRLDFDRSRCPAKYSLSITRTSKESSRSPCSNVPLRCPLCPKNSAAVWKYNMRYHLARAHQQDPEQYTSLWKLSDAETAAMKALYEAKSRSTKRKRQTEKASKFAKEISEGHVCKLALRYANSPS
ncbi:hypothetical protein K466DRAFT_502203 [Polyporus arcularius HHB13444]|uniref:C2H2-type domain-containing protein n=1 Tax=Polyporus arcularius HHB13444 TaxID=1314778 RepID=A0A5C3NZC6_9APHY|nr:hypothetical protein K466DRAFT_502203 [Polyporus arcularius HHB13444]